MQVRGEYFSSAMEEAAHVDLGAVEFDSTTQEDAT